MGARTFHTGKRPAVSSQARSAGPPSSSPLECSTRNISLFPTLLGSLGSWRPGQAWPLPSQPRKCSTWNIEKSASSFAHSQPNESTPTSSRVLGQRPPPRSAQRQGKRKRGNIFFAREGFDEGPKQPRCQARLRGEVKRTRVLEPSPWVPDSRCGYSPDRRDGSFQPHSQQQNLRRQAIFEPPAVPSLLT